MFVQTHYNQGLVFPFVLIVRELRLMRNFRHPNIIGLHDLGRPADIENFNDV